MMLCQGVNTAPGLKRITLTFGHRTDQNQQTIRLHHRAAGAA